MFQEKFNQYGFITTMRDYASKNGEKGGRLSLSNQTSPKNKTGQEEKRT
jgi:hypothetical protein